MFWGLCKKPGCCNIEMKSIDVLEGNSAVKEGLSNKVTIGVAGKTNKKPPNL